MRNRWILFLAWLAAVCGVCPHLAAQFQEPTQAELKMVSDPMALGADAVYLNVSEVDDNLGHFQSYYARIKVLTEAGESLATVRIPFARGETKISRIEARTIHPDGTVIPLIAKPEELESLKIGKIQVKMLVFTLPGVLVGSIIEYSYKMSYSVDDYSAPSWEIQKHYLIHNAHYEFKPSPRGGNLVWWFVLPRGVKVQRDSKGGLVLNMQNVPPIPNEDWMPPIESVLYKVIFYFSNAFTENAFWKPTIQGWSESVNQFADPSTTIRDAVNGLVSPGDSDEMKAKKLYAAVQGLENTDFTRAKDKAERKKLKEKDIKHAQDVWTQRSGNRQAIALLYLAMLRAAGLKAYAMRVVDRDQGLFAEGYLSFAQLDDMVVLVTLNGKEVVTDPGEKMCPFREVNWAHSLATGIRENDAGGMIATTSAQPYHDNQLIRTGMIHIDSSGNAKGELTFTMTGQDALRWREAAVLNDLTEVKKQFNDWAVAMVPQGVEASLEQFTGLDNEDVPLTATIEVHGMLGTPLGKRLMLPGEFFDTREHRPFVGQEKREEPVDMQYGQEISDRVVYQLPAGMNVEGAPPDAKVAWPGHAVMIAHTGVEPGEVTLTRTLARAFTYVQADDYQNLRAFYQKMAAADHTEIVLKAGQQGTMQSAAGGQGKGQ